MIAANRVRGLRVHNFAGKFTVTTLLVFLMISGLELNPGPNSVNGEASMDCTGTHDDNSTHTEQCTTDQPTTMQQILQSVQSLSSSVKRIEERLESSQTVLTAKIQNVEDKLDAQLSKLHDNQETLFNDVDALYENYQDLQSSHEQLQALVDRLESKIDSLENQSRRNNLIFGLPLDGSETWEDCECKVRDIIRRNMKINKEVEIERAHPLGKNTVMVKFLSFKDRDLVMSRARNLKGSDPPLFVRDDVSEAVRSKQKGLLPLRNSLRDDHKRAVIRYDKLRTDVGTFTFDLKKQEIVKLDSTPVSIGTRAAATPFRRQSNQCISSNGGSSERLPSASLNDFPSHVFQPGEETAGLESNGITGSDSVSVGEGADDCGTTTHPHRRDTGSIDNRLYSTVAGQTARGGRRGRGGGSTRPPRQPGRGPGRQFGGRGNLARAQGLSQSAPRGGNGNNTLPTFQRNRRTDGNAALSNWR